MNRLLKNSLLFLFVSTFCCIIKVNAHETASEVRYLGNEGVMVTDGKSKVLFDPFFHNNFGIYTLVPDELREAIFTGKPPFDDISAVFVSHAHADHFDANDLLSFLKANSKAHLIAPQQAVDQLKELPGTANITNRISAIKLLYGDKPMIFTLGNIIIEAIRIPHAGWPKRAKLQNIVYRLTLNNRVSVMHMGDADPDKAHFSPYASFWKQRTTDVAFPPYWFMLSDEGNKILDKAINAKSSIGIHVESNVPESLKNSGKLYFSVPGETKSIVNIHTH